mmetsp:Transcript_54114/g.139783  ORF Transcript_54114/g.139783 Transcript_54114/m.139783 type:complete len:247 (+) Transcript_54114:566-1306(+)
MPCCDQRSLRSFWERSYTRASSSSCSAQICWGISLTSCLSSVRSACKCSRLHAHSSMPSWAIAYLAFSESTPPLQRSRRRPFCSRQRPQTYDEELVALLPESCSRSRYVIWYGCPTSRWRSFETPCGLLSKSSGYRTRATSSTDSTMSLAISPSVSCCLAAQRRSAATHLYLSVGVRCWSPSSAVSSSPASGSNGPATRPASCVEQSSRSRCLSPMRRPSRGASRRRQSRRRRRTLGTVGIDSTSR